MAFFLNRTPTDLTCAYGYWDRSTTDVDLDLVGDKAHGYVKQPYNRKFELLARTVNIAVKAKPPEMTQEEVDGFNNTCKTAFREIGELMGYSPVVMWEKTKDLLISRGVSLDDCDDVEKFCLGWKDFTQTEMERYRYRYTTECPLVEALHTLFAEHCAINALREWIFELKRNQAGRDPKVLPVVPSCDGRRPPSKSTVVN